MPEFNIDEALKKGPTAFDPNDKLVVETHHDPRGDKPVDTELFDRVMSGEKLTREEVIDGKKSGESKPEDKVEDKTIPKLPQSEADKLAAEEKASAEALAKKQKEAEEAEKKQEEEAKAAKEKEEADKLAKLPPTAKPRVPATEDVDAIVKDLGLPDTATALFKKMDKSARDYVVAEIKRTRSELESTKASLETAKKSTRNDIPVNWYDHKQAYALTPEFQGAVATANKMKDYAAHFREQLINIESGEDWIDMVMNPETGAIHNVPRKTTSADAVRTKYAILDRIKGFEEIAKDKERESQHIAGQFMEYHKNLHSDIKEKCDEYFPQYADDKEFSQNEWGKYAMNMLEANGQGHNPIAPMFARLYAFALETQAENQKLKGNGKPNIPPVNTNGPTGDTIDKGTVGDKRGVLGSDDSPFDEDAFEKLKTRGQIQ